MSTARERMFVKLKALGGIPTMPKPEWDDFLNELPRDEYLELIAWWTEETRKEQRN